MGDGAPLVLVGFGSPGVSPGVNRGLELPWVLPLFEILGGPCFGLGRGFPGLEVNPGAPLLNSPSVVSVDIWGALGRGESPYWTGV